MYNEVTLEHVKEHLFIVPDTLWTLVQHASTYKDLVPVVDALYADGYSVRRLLQSCVPWLLANAGFAIVRAGGDGVSTGTACVGEGR